MDALAQCVPLSPVGDCLHAIQLLITDSRGVVTPLDFMFTTVSAAADHKPVISTNALPVYRVPPGYPIQFTVTASDVDPAVHGLPIAAGPDLDRPGSISREGSATSIQTAGDVDAWATVGGPVSVTFSWIPSAADAGSRILTFSATDDQVGIQATTSVTVVVDPTLSSVLTGTIRATSLPALRTSPRPTATTPRRWC